MAAPIPAPPAKPATAPTPIATLLPSPQKLKEPAVLEHRDAAAPIPAPAPAPMPPTINALRRRWLLSSNVTRMTFSFLIPTSFPPSRSCIASSVTVENVPLCFLRLLSMISIRCPACRAFSAAHEFSGFWARAKIGIPSTISVTATLRIESPFGAQTKDCVNLLPWVCPSIGQSSVDFWKSFRPLHCESTVRYEFSPLLRPSAARAAAILFRRHSSPLSCIPYNFSFRRVV